MARRRYGEVKRSRSKTQKAWARSFYRGGGVRRGPTITTHVERGRSGTYGATACVGSLRARLHHHSPRCGYAHGTTPSAALSKAVRAVAGKFRHWKSI